MLKKVVAALLVTVAFMPAAHAQDEGQEGRSAGMSRRAEMREARQQAAQARSEAPRQYQRQEAPQQAQRPAEAQRAEQAPRFQRQPDQPRPAPQAQTQTPVQAQPQRPWQGYGDRGSRGNMFAQRAQRQQTEQQAQTQVQAQVRQRDGDRTRGNQQGDWRRGEAGRNRPNVVDQRRDGNRTVGGQRRWNDNNGSHWNANRGYGSNNDWRSNTNAFGRGDWSRGWRDDNRYDWGRYRQQNRNLFRLPRYYAPYDWSYGYRRFSIGVTLSSLLWSQDYWIDEPEYYRLPPAYGPYRWVRYYNDALLVDIRTGYVVDTVYDIFWG